MKKILQLVLSLTIISAVCAAVLAAVNAVTKDRIASLSALKANNAAKAVLPKGVATVDARPDPANKALVAFVGYEDAKKVVIAGYAVPGISENGYGGAIRLMVGLTADRKVISYQVLAANETPGLGAKLGDAEFAKQFAGKAAATLAVKKDGGEIEAITGATITSRAVCGAIADAVARLDRIEGKAPAAAAAKKPAPDPVGKMLHDPMADATAKLVLPKTTVKIVKVAGSGFPSFIGKDAKGQTTGYAVIGTGKGHGPNGDFTLHYLFGATARRQLSMNPPPVKLNEPGIPMTDMEDAQRMAFNAAMRDAITQFQKLH